MSTVQSDNNTSQPDIRVSFQVSEDFKLAIDLAVTKARTTLRDFCTRALAEKLGIPVPGEEPAPEPRKRKIS
ncbi:MAG TPA: hypothetical protein VNH18_29465 [Bryobacteraceae bacterium]|nr:hypothetical protein [Blastocatellia bacterium]HXJ43447.1 hypothetical protein [Bryobacteraceae bacterium]